VDDANVVEVYWAKDAPHAHLVKTALQKAGIPAEVVGEMLQAAVGDLPWGPSTSPRVWVAKQDEARARAVIAEWERQRREEPDDGGVTWACPHCGAEVDAGFDVCWKCQGPRPEGE
jgi:hypothetical protein